MVKLPNKTLERTLLAQGYTCIVGLDEVGMACLAGPVVVAATLFRPAFFARRWKRLEYLRDSKMLQAHQRERYARELASHRFIHHAVAVVHPREVDRLNVYRASLVGMRRAVRRLGLSRQDKPFVLLDGRGRIPDIPWPQQAIIKGDRKVFAVAAASILAKVHRDGMMTRYARRYPAYGFERHKGYPTASHRRQLEQAGPCPLHRRSFCLLKR
jgi:ribonuclease HII